MSAKTANDSFEELALVPIQDLERLLVTEDDNPTASSPRLTEQFEKLLQIPENDLLDAIFEILQSSDYTNQDKIAIYNALVDKLAIRRKNSEFTGASVTNAIAAQESEDTPKKPKTGDAFGTSFSGSHSDTDHDDSFGGSTLLDSSDTSSGNYKTPYGKLPPSASLLDESFSPYNKGGVSLESETAPAQVNPQRLFEGSQASTSSGAALSSTSGSTLPSKSKSASEEQHEFEPDIKKRKIGFLQPPARIASPARNSSSFKEVIAALPELGVDVDDIVYLRSTKEAIVTGARASLIWDYITDSNPKAKRKPRGTDKFLEYMGRAKVGEQYIKNGQSLDVYTNFASTWNAL